MSLKTKLVLSITTLVFAIAGTLSLVYVRQLLHAAIQESYETDRMVANQIRFALQHALEAGLTDRTVDPNNPAELRNLAAAAVRDNAQLQAMLDSVNRYSLTVYDINIGDSSGVTLLSTNPENEDKPLPTRRSLNLLVDANPFQFMAAVFGPPQVFDVAVPLDRNGQPFLSVHIGVRTTFLRAVYQPWLTAALVLMSIALAVALVLAFLLSSLLLRPMEKISKQLDYWMASAEQPTENESTSRHDMAVRVSRKIEHFGQRMRNTEEVFTALKENLDRFLGNLQDGILLFTPDGRAILVSEAARRFLDMEKDSILGKHLAEIFDRNTMLGHAVCQAFEAGDALVLKEIVTEAGRRIQASLDFIQSGEADQGLGALVTLHDLESVKEIETDLELSRRMAAIGRLTSGVGHEVKNPINAIVVHLELLKQKIGKSGDPAARHLSIIDTEIHRLDRVVQLLVDFSRPVDLALHEQDLSGVVEEVLALTIEDLRNRSINLVTRIAPQPLFANIDVDFLKQAVLNVIQNGAQAMPDGGTLEVVLEEDKPSLPVAGRTGATSARSALLRITDHGPGIPEDIQEKIFDLFFTTKSGGSGIGLAMTYRILQLHSGSIAVQSSPEHGTEFQLRIPLAPAQWNRKTLPFTKDRSKEGLPQ